MVFGKVESIEKDDHTHMTNWQLTLQAQGQPWLFSFYSSKNLMIPKCTF